MTASPPLAPDLPPPPGVTCVRDAAGLVTGVDVAVPAPHATAVYLCLFDEDGTERRVRLRHRAHGTWFDRVPGVAPGDRYGLRADGPWEPEAGHRHNVHKLLVDPWARALDGAVDWSPEVFGHEVDASFAGDGAVRDERDSAGRMPRCVVVDEQAPFDWAGDRPPATPWGDTVVYEAHVRGLTRLHPEVPEELRGTYAGLAHPAVTGHLRSLGVTAVELLPVHAHTSEPHLVRMGLTNYWGYNTLGFLAPHPAYAAATQPLDVVDEVKAMVRDLHAAGLEVILDVVHNHTCEQASWTGATLSLRGLGNATFYRLGEGGRDLDVTGCGNTLDFGDPNVIRLTLDSLRHWVREYHVDGFRFDLAPALARGRDGAFDPGHPLLVALRTDPVLSRVKLIAEPWDIGPDGWRTGQFPPPFSEWNDRFRDGARTFWLRDQAAPGSGSGVRDLATRLAGSSDLFGHGDRLPTASINLVTAHDGFTLHDLAAYDRKHNEENGEGNRDGSDSNLSWNHGVEGATADETVLAARRRSVRALLGTLLMATGVPMVLAGDELGRTQGGNNNPYARDDRTSWVDWSLAPWQEDLLETARHLLRLRREHPALGHHAFFPSEPVPGDGVPSLHWLGADGQPMTGEQWASPRTHTLGMYIEPEAQEGAAGPEAPGLPAAVYVVLHNGTGESAVTLPAVSGREDLTLLWSSAWESPARGSDEDDLAARAGEVIPLDGPAMLVWEAR